MDYIDLGLQVKKARLARNLTQQKVAEMIGVSTNYVGTIERAEGIPSLETVINLANALNVSVLFLLQDSLTELSQDDTDREIESMLQTAAPQEKAYILEQLRVYRKFNQDND